MYQTPREKRMMTGFIENCCPKSHGSRMLPTRMCSSSGTKRAMTLWYGSRLSSRMIGTTSSVEMVGPSEGMKLSTKVASATKRPSGKEICAEKPGGGRVRTHGGRPRRGFGERRDGGAT